jgi:hypothetical protein
MDKPPGYVSISPHAVHRAAERHGVDISPAVLNAIILDITETVAGIRSAALMLSREQPPYRNATLGPRETWMVHLGPCDVRVVWCPATASVVTVLTNGLKLGR